MDCVDQPESSHRLSRFAGEQPSGLAQNFFGTLTNQLMTEDQCPDYFKHLNAAAAPATGIRQFGSAMASKRCASGMRSGAVVNFVGKITRADVVWPRLRLWVNTTHDAIWPNGEVLTLDQAGITEISLTYLRDTRLDEYGNQFRFRGSVKTKTIPSHVPEIWDVFLVTRNYRRTVPGRQNSWKKFRDADLVFQGGMMTSW